MKNKELKRLNRKELLELLLEQTKENERLRQELDRANEALAERNLRISKAGNLAEAVVVVNEVMEAADAAVKQYIDNIRLMEDETRKKCEEILRKAREEAADIQKAAKDNAQG